jgi:hypothetical protein
MMMNRPRDVLEDAQNKAVGMGHFNIADGRFLKAVMAAAQELKAPVSVGRRAFLRGNGSDCSPGEKPARRTCVQMGGAGPFPANRLKAIYSSLLAQMRNWEEEQHDSPK